MNEEKSFTQTTSSRANVHVTTNDVAVFGVLGTILLGMLFYAALIYSDLIFYAVCGAFTGRLGASLRRGIIQYRFNRELRKFLK